MSHKLIVGQSFAQCCLRGILVVVLAVGNSIVGVGHDPILLCGESIHFGWLGNARTFCVLSSITMDELVVLSMFGTICGPLTIYRVLVWQYARTT